MDTDGSGLIGVLASLTGGNIFFHPRFDPSRDRLAVHNEMKRVITEEVVYNATVRIRCSNGMSEVPCNISMTRLIGRDQ